MRVSEAMTRDVRVATPGQSIRDVAKMMAEIDAGAMPVGENDRLVGMVTDRDIAIRAVAQGKGPDTPVREVMSSEVKYCFEDEDLEHVAKNMGDIQLRRLPVVNREKRLVGIVALGDVARKEDHATTGEGEQRRAQQSHWRSSRRAPRPRRPKKAGPARATTRWCVRGARRCAAASSPTAPRCTPGSPKAGRPTAAALR